MTDTSNNILPPPVRSSRSYIFYAIFLPLLLLLSISSPSDGAESKNVLVLHSYHQGLVWTDHIMEGIYSRFNKSGIDAEILIEYMDTKRYFDGPGGKYVQRLREMYKDKYGAMKLDVIISSDDNAFQFLLSHHDELFPGTPIVFCGVNNFEDKMLAGHETLITGVVEFLDKKANIDIALALHPEADQVAIITDTSTTGTGNRKILEELADEYRGRAEFTFIDKDNSGLTLQELLERLKQLKEGSVIYYSDFLRSGGKYIVQETAVPEISRVSARPIYTHYDEILGLGVVGGKLVNGLSHGRTAAQIAIGILQGTPAGSIPVHKESINTYMFDYLQLQRFDIDEDILPEGSIIINTPFSFYSKYKYLVWTVSGVFAFLLLSLIAISFNVAKRKKAEQELQKAHDELDQKVKDRTKDLSRVNLELQAEIIERTKAEAQLVTAASEWRNTFDSITDFVSIHDRDFRFLRANKALCQLTGIDARDLIGKHCYEVFHNSKGPIAGCPYKEMIGSNQGTTREIYEQRMDKHLMISVSPIIEGGETKGYVHYVKDITMRKKMEEQLRVSEEMYRKNFYLQKSIAAVLDMSLEALPLQEQLGSILDSIIPVPLFGDMGKGCIFTYDKNMGKLVLQAQRGMPEGMLAQCSLLDLGKCLCGTAAARQEIIFSEDIDERHEISYPEIEPHSKYCIPMLYGSDLLGVVTFYFSPGHKRNHEEETFFLSVANAIAGVLKRRNSEEALKISEEQFRGAFEYSSIGIGLVSPEGTWLKVNPTLCKIVGYSEQELLSRAFQDITHPDDLEADLGYVRKMLAGEIPYFHLEKRYIHKEGHIVWIWLSVSLVRDRSGSPLHFVSQVQDITERKIAEEQIRRSLEEKAVLLQEIHHRVKNNMTVIHSLLELQSSYIYDKRDREMFHESMNRIKSMALIHERLYHSEDLANIDFGEYLNTMIDSMFQSYGLTSGEVSLRTDISGVALGIGVAIPCGLIVNELVSNALKYAFPEGMGGEIIVALRIIDNDEIELSVGDNGIGIPAGLDYRHTKTLGLNLVNALVKQLKGTIRLDRESGTEFRITFRQSE